MAAPSRAGVEASSYFVLILAVGLTGCGMDVTGGRLAQLTFSKDIAPIIWQHCSGCHRPGEIGPFSLITYEDVRSHARKIVTATTAMPGKT